MIFITIAARSGKNIFKSFQNNLRFQLFKFQNKRVALVIKEVRAQHLSFLGDGPLRDLAQVAIDNEKYHLDGIIVEAGCALGGSAITLASAKQKERKLFVYDVFGPIPPPSEKDGVDVHNRYQIIVSGNAKGLGNNNYYGYEDNLYDKVVQTFADFGFQTAENNIYLIKGLYEETLQIKVPIALAHIDCDWYDSVMVCLNRIEPNLVKGGTLVIDDYYHWSGCRKAVDEYFSHSAKGDYKFIKKNRLHIVKL